MRRSLRADAHATWIRRIGPPSILNSRKFGSARDGSSSTLNNLKIGEHTRVIFQGFTGEISHRLEPTFSHQGFVD